MRRLAALAVLLLLAGCERSFDDRYADAEKAIRDKAKAIDVEIAASASQAAALESGAAVSSPAPASPPAER